MFAIDWLRQYALGIGSPLLSHIGVATVNHDLPLKATSPLSFWRGAGDEAHIGLLTADEQLSLLRGIHRLRDDKIFRLCQSFYGLLCTGRHL